MLIAQTLFYVVSPLVTLLAVSVAYIALLRQSRPHLLVYYSTNPNIQTFIDLVIENVGGGMARDVRFSQPLPVKYFGIESPDGSGKDVLDEGLPAVASGQRLVFDGGQYSGLKKRIGEQLTLEVTYYYTNPIGIRRQKKDFCVLSVSYLAHMPTRNSAETAVVDALKGHNNSTLKTIANEMKNISAAIERLSDQSDD